MLTGLLHWIADRPARAPYDEAFVAEVRPPAPPRDPRLVRFILVCWILIAVKHVAVIWLVQQYRMPFHQLIVNFPTWLIGAVATALYLRRTE